LLHEFSIRFDDGEKHADAEQVDAETDDDDEDSAQELGSGEDGLPSMLNEKTPDGGEHGEKNARYHQRYANEQNAPGLLPPIHGIERRRIEEVDIPGKKDDELFHDVPARKDAAACLTGEEDCKHALMAKAALNSGGIFI
jgi:hypothetical protein